MPYFLRHNDEMINLDLVASINKSQFDYHSPFEDKEKEITYTIIFWGAYLYPDGTTNKICSLEFDDKEIRDKIFNDICNNIQFNFRSTFIEIKN